jgi:hypothetical protein
MKTYIGIDNGATGTIGICNDSYSAQIKVPVIKVQDYTKKKKILSRLDIESIAQELVVNHLTLAEMHGGTFDFLAVLERPFTISPTDPKFVLRYNTIISGMRIFEAWLVFLEIKKIPYRFIDSKTWQKEFFPKDANNKTHDLKKLSLQYGRQLFPKIAEFLKPDADGILIAEYARRQRW